MLNELDIVRDVSARFERAGIEYMLTGSMAMNYYAQPRMTRDIDIVVALVPKNADAIVGMFTPEARAVAPALRTNLRLVAAGREHASL
jgi:hypothetical protein